jgi:hypothetical protein
MSAGPPEGLGWLTDSQRTALATRLRRGRESERIPGRPADLAELPLSPANAAAARRTRHSGWTRLGRADGNGAGSPDDMAAEE